MQFRVCRVRLISLLESLEYYTKDSWVSLRTDQTLLFLFQENSLMLCSRLLVKKKKKNTFEMLIPKLASIVFLIEHHFQ